MTPENPLLDEYNSALAQGDSNDIEETRTVLLSRYSFAIPTRAALGAIADASPSGVVEVGAGTGYWAMLLAGLGVDILAFDADPAPSATNQWFAGCAPWFEITKADETIAGLHPRRTLLLVWPNRNAMWASHAVRAYHGAGGECVALVGERPGGRTGDYSLHKLLGNADECVSCRYGIVEAPCTCAIPRCFEPDVRVMLPHWPGYEDDLTIHRRVNSVAPVATRRRRRRS